MIQEPNVSGNADLVRQINELMASGFEIPTEKLMPSANLVADLGLDSLDAVDMLVFIEDKFNIKVEGEKLRSLQTLQDVYDLAFDAVGTTTTVM